MSARPLRPTAKSSTSSLSTGDVLALSAPLVAISIALAVIGDLAAHLEWTLALLTLAFAAFVLAVRRLERARPSAEPATARREAGRRRLQRVPGGALGGCILLAALLIRLPLLLLPPSLSDDLLRYVWDGRVVAAGANPYHLPPDSVELASLRDERWQRMPHREVPTVYPPFALGLFAAAASSGVPDLALKSLLTLADLAGCLALLALAAARGLPIVRVAWYAWNPTVALEVAGMGHVDALAVAAAVCAVWALVARRPATAGVAAAAGVLVKLGPLVALPAWARLTARPLRFLFVALAVSAAVLAPVVWAAGGVPPGLVEYGVSWEFNGPLYEPLWRLLDAADVDGSLHALLDRLKEWSGDYESWNVFYPHVYPQLLAKLLLALLMVGVVILSLAGGEPEAATGRLFGGLLLLSATIYPWYLLWVLPWAALRRHPGWLALSGLILLSYLPQHRPVELFPWLFAAVWLPFALISWRSSRWSTG